jgi:hypothetical protein
MEKYKKILEKTEQYIQFSDEELQELGWKENQKLSIELTDGGIMLKPFVKVDIDMSNWSREILEYIISESCEKDISVNEVISNTIEQALKYEKENNK